MPQLKEDEWPDTGEPTTTERETGAEPAPSGGGNPEPAGRTATDDPARLKNVRPDEAVD